MKKPHFQKSQVIRTTTLIAGLAITATIILTRDTSYTYAVPSNNGNGLHYEYYTEAMCKVTDVTETEVFVTYKGKTYSFYYENGTDCKVGDKWKVTFNSAMEIVDCQ